eukprot:1523305-Rhodomonas_salina.1
MLDRESDSAGLAGPTTNRTADSSCAPCVGSEQMAAVAAPQRDQHPRHCLAALSRGTGLAQNPPLNSS